MNPLEPPSPELAALLAAMADEPEDLSRKLVVADWLEEHGDPRCELFREAANDGSVAAWLKRHGEQWPGKETAQVLTHQDGRLMLRWTGRVRVAGTPPYPQQWRDVVDPGRWLIDQRWVTRVDVRGDASYYRLLSSNRTDCPAELLVRHVPVSDTAMERLAGCRDLRSLSWHGADGGHSRPAFPFEGLRGLRSLFLRSVAGVQLDELPALADLRQLTLRQATVRRPALAAALVGMRSLEHLTLDGQGLDPTVFDGLARLERLKRIELHEWNCAKNRPYDRLGLAAQLSQVECLALRSPAPNTRPDPVAVSERLRRMASLKRLVFATTDPTLANDLRRELPHVEIVDVPF